MPPCSDCRRIIDTPSNRFNAEPHGMLRSFGVDTTTPYANTLNYRCKVCRTEFTRTERPSGDVQWYRKPPAAHSFGKFEMRNVAEPEQDTPGLAFDLLSWRVNLAILVPLIAVSLVAWVITIEQANSMRNMAMGLGHIGYREHGDMGALEFLAMWIAMMTAMMLPTIAPIVLAHHAVALRRNEGALSTLAFVAGYLLVWWGVGIVVLLAYWGFARLGADAAQSRWLLTLAGESLVFAGVWQFTRWKQRGAEMCRHPLALVFKHDFRRGMHNALRAGFIHGAHCLLCCWAAMLVLLVIGLMNLVWMTILFVLFFVEKNSKYGRTVANVAGIGLMLIGIAILTSPALLRAISD